MSFFLIFAVVLVIGLYWVMTQVRRSGKREAALLRPGVAEGLMEGMNLRRREHGLPILEWEENLTVVAENKAVHQLLTGRDE
ncbi:MAG: hypothetical protein DLM70_00480, partial [Chloroflexi bacterium]